MENNVYILGPIIIPLLCAAISLRLSPFPTWQRGLALCSAVAAWLCSATVLYAVWDEQAIQLYHLGGWRPPFGIVLVVDMFGALFGIMATTILLAGTIYSVQSIEQSTRYPVYIPLFLTMSAGIMGAFYTGDLFTLFVFVELMVISSVILVAVSDNQLGLEAAMKYLVISAMGSLFLLIGISAVYASTGTLNMADISRRLNVDDSQLLTRAAAVMLMAAFLLKSAVFPFHFWQPDFHTTAPTPVGAMLSSIVVKVGIFGIIRTVTLLFRGDSVRTIENILIVLGIIGIFFGSLGALRTYHAKRMLAYSTFGQIGFILVGIGWGTPAALLGAIVYAFNHAFIKSSLLMLTGVVSSHTKTKTGTLKNMAGAGHKLALTSMLYFLGGMALAGIPPMNGFISKLALVRGGISEQNWISLGLVVGAGVITLLYMTRTWVLIFQRIPTSETADLKKPGEGDSPLAPALLIICCVVLGLYAAPLIELAQIAVNQLTHPQIYINAVLGG